MNTRRKFLIQGSMATAAMLALKPFSSIAGNTSTFTGGSSGNYLHILHTANLQSCADFKVQQAIASSTKSNANAILLNAGQENGGAQFDVEVINGDYEIIRKGNVKMGIIKATKDQTNIIEQINTLSAWLKKEKGCTVVVCLSQLGYKNNNIVDDITLAAKSTNLDVIIGGHKDNFHQHPVVALNKNNSEVIIHSAAGQTTGLGKIEIAFNEKGQKRNIGFSGIA